MALENNVDLEADRLDPQISDTRVAAAVGAVQADGQRERAAQQSAAAAVQLPDPDVRRAPTSSTSNVGLSQRLPWFGTIVQRRMGRVAHRQQQLPQQLQPAAAVGPGAQRLAAAAPRLARSIPRGSSSLTSRINRDIADTRLQRERRPHHRRGEDARTGICVSARANVDARRKALELAQELVRVNKAKVDVGQSPPIDLRVGPGRSRREPGAAHRRRDGRQAGRRSAARC